VDINPTRDTYVQDGSSADTNFGTSTDLVVKTSPQTGVNRNTWLAFDTSGYAKITAVTLRLFVTSVQSTATNPIPLILYYPPNSSRGWAEQTMTWNNAPPAGTDVVSTLAINSPNVGTWIEFDVTAAVAPDATGAPTFMLTSTPATNRDAMFSSREGANPPVLRITTAPP
jgi:hyaluronate lyase